MFELLRTSHKSGALVGCSLNTNESDETRHRDSGLGILRGHAYGILRIVERTVKHEDDDDDEMLRLLQLRNPWGMKEWMGDFSDGDTIWDDYPEIKRELVGKDGFSNDGVFWMSWYDFVSEFNQVFVCEDRDHKTWHGTRFEGTWDKKVSNSCPGGCPRYKTFPSNPQYAFQVDEPTSIEIVVFQRDIRWLDRVTKYKYGVGFVIIRLQGSSSFRVTKFSSRRDVVGKSRSFVMDRHVYTRLPQKLPAGRYVVVPCSYRPNELNETEYGLEVYTDHPVRWFHKDGISVDNHVEEEQEDNVVEEEDDEGEDSSYVMEKRSEPEPEQQGRALAAMQRELMSLSKEVASMREMMDRMEKRLERALGS
eukprot:g2461.t1